MLRIYLGKGSGSFRETLEQYIRIIWDDCGHDKNLLHIYLFAFFSDMLLLLHRTDRFGFMQDQLHYAPLFLQPATVPECMRSFIDTVAAVLDARPRHEIESAIRRKAVPPAPENPPFCPPPSTG